MKKNRWMIIISLVIFCICFPVKAGEKVPANAPVYLNWSKDIKDYTYNVDVYSNYQSGQYIINENDISGNFEVTSITGCTTCLLQGQLYFEKNFHLKIDYVKDNCKDSLCKTTINFNVSYLHLFSKVEVFNYTYNFNIKYIPDYIRVYDKDTGQYEILKNNDYIDNNNNNSGNNDNTSGNNDNTSGNNDNNNGNNDNNNGNNDNNNITCEGIFSDELMDFLVDALKVVKILVPLLIIVLGSADLLRNVFAGKDEDMKKGWNRLFKRFIFGLLVYVLIYIVQVLFPIANGYIGGCLDNFDE